MFKDLEGQMESMAQVPFEQRQCKNTCDLIIAPHWEWESAEGHKVDFSKALTWGYDDTSRKGLADETVMCRDMSLLFETNGRIWEFVTTEPRCEDRFARHDQCHGDFSKAQEDWTAFTTALQAALAVSQAELMTFSAIKDFFKYAKVKTETGEVKNCSDEVHLDVSLFLNTLGSQMDSHVWNLLTWSPRAAGAWKQQGRAFNCFDNSDDWLEVVGGVVNGETGGYFKRAGASPAHSDKLVLKDQPCPTAAFCSLTSNKDRSFCVSGDKGGTNDLFGCENLRDPSDSLNKVHDSKLDWGWTGGSWQYRKVKGPAKPSDFTVASNIL
eukprot:Cvel_5056.t2-p1 / transcript=Cvel_5056.t2 / gene=Cvel_5056 / organism=Chromera_velia_CCMP2878 / gene_product=hypothetical protein / transcript_product=hypothetical protein / location=Cvel_scaffold230:70256-71227(-) / protein_length=324 / sequence_SO=supercontig / SO=protein_coding / is_pseudo=false